ncbi:MAG: metal ABC transporter permease [Opitutales bacterium]|nr:metal ABC transporter permease [Opitutales bacterium]
MNEFWQTLTDPDMRFFRSAFYMGLLASVSFGIVGSYVVAKRVSYIAGAISHAVLAGIGASVFFSRTQGWTALDPVTGALISALLAAFLLSWARLASGDREDSLIGAIWSIGMAVGLLFFAATPGYTDPMSYLFGNILLIGPEDLRRVFILDVIIVVIAVTFYQQLQAVCFDEEFARVRGIHTGFFYTLLLVLIAFTVVLLISVVGMVLVVALLTLPAAAAGPFVRSLRQMMALSTVLCLLYLTAGLYLSFRLDWPTGPTVIVLAGAGYLVALVAARLGWGRA